MKWKYSGQLANISSSGLDPVELEGELYLIRRGYCVPFYQPLSGNNAVERRRRERLNIELCNRVFRISDARDVLRRTEIAETAITKLQQEYEQNIPHTERGTGRILFGRITAQIRDLSREYIEQQDTQILDKIKCLYSYLMVEQREIFSCVRLYDHSEDRDGIIEEAFSEIGKPQQQSLSLIYESRVAKIAAAMADIHETYSIMDSVITSAIRADKANTLLATLQKYADQTARLSGFPTFDANVYDQTAIAQVNLMDENIDLIKTHARSSDDYMLTEWMKDGVRLIDSMQIIRDARTNSVAEYKQLSTQWL